MKMEDLLFAYFKDKAIINADYFRINVRKFFPRATEKQIVNTYRMVTNYQLNNYGDVLINKSLVYNNLRKK